MFSKPLWWKGLRPSCCTVGNQCSLRGRFYPKSYSGCPRSWLASMRCWTNRRSSPRSYRSSIRGWGGHRHQRRPIIPPPFGSATIRLTHYRLSGRRVKDRRLLNFSFRRCSGDGHGNLMQVIETSIPAVLRERASLQPNDTAFTFIDYEQDWDGVAESLTWSQAYRRTLSVARELKHCGSTGDRAVILAPQGLDYIVAFLGALQAGHIAVPLSVPMGGVHDERVSSVLRDASPVGRSHDVLCRRQCRRVRQVAARGIRSIGRRG